MSKLAQNPQFGRPSPNKLKARLKGWQAWARGMKTLREIHAEVEPKVNAMRLALEV
jgi:hypothetical protein